MPKRRPENGLLNARATAERSVRTNFLESVDQKLTKKFSRIGEAGGASLPFYKKRRPEDLGLANPPESKFSEPCITNLDGK